jgi:hypothetical protein
VRESGAILAIGSGDSEKAMNESGYSDHISFASPGRGASRAFIGGDILFCIAALMKESHTFRFKAKCPRYLVGEKRKRKIANAEHLIYEINS